MNASFPHESRRLRELQRVQLLGQYTSDEVTLRPGAEGTIVYRHRNGEAFEVEFPNPMGTVLTLKSDEIVGMND